MKMRVMRLLMAFIILISSIVPGIHALQDVNPNGYVDDLSSLPTPGKHTAAPQSMVQALSAQHELVCAAGLTVAGIILVYMVHPAFRKKVNGYLGIHAEANDNAELMNNE